MSDLAPYCCDVYYTITNRRGPSQLFLTASTSIKGREVEAQSSGSFWMDSDWSLRQLLTFIIGNICPAPLLIQDHYSKQEIVSDEQLSALIISCNGYVSLTLTALTETFEVDDPDSHPPYLEVGLGPELIHTAFCDCCHQRIRGIRYKCMQCPDYDLCEECEEMQGLISFHDEDHFFAKLFLPTLSPQFLPRPLAAVENCL